MEPSGVSTNSSIQWTDATWNPVRGCTKVSPGCAHCYAETFAERFRGVKGHPYEQGFDLRLVPEKLIEPLSWKKPRRVFVNSMSDLFQEGVPDEFIDQVFAVMAMTPQHTYQVLTKRADRMRAYCADPHRPAAIDTALLWAVSVANRSWKCLVQPNAPSGVEGWPISNVWLGVSVENQHFADERIPLLLQTPAAVRFISAEPLLGPLVLSCGYWLECEPGLNLPTLDWVIVGGESGHGSRPCHTDWIANVVLQCARAGVPCFVKQLGSNGYQLPGGYPLRDRKGGDMGEWPEDLRVREFPKAAAQGWTATLQEPEQP